MQRWALPVVLLVAIAAVLWFVLGDKARDTLGLPGEDARDRVANDAGGPALRIKDRVDDATSDALAPDRVLGGIVVDEGQRPLPDVLVELLTYPRRSAYDNDAGFLGTWGAGAVLATTHTDAAGRFGFAQPSFVGQVEVHALPGAPWTSVVYAWHASGLATRDLRLVARRGHALRGRVLGLDGTPTRARVSAVHFPDSYDDEAPAWVAPEQATDASGRFSLPAVPRGVIQFDVTLPGGAARRGIPVRVPARDEVVLDLSLSSPAMIEGTVSDPAGKPVAGAAISIDVLDRFECQLRWFVGATSDDTGHFRLAPLGPGRIARVRIERTGFVPMGSGLRGVALGAGETKRLDVTLSPSSAIAGRIVDRAGQPLANAFVHVTGDGEVWDAFEWTARTDEQGRYRVEGLPASWLLVRPFAQGYYVDPSRTPSGNDFTQFVQPPGAVIERNYVMAPGSPVTGTVRDASGAPVAGVLVSAKPTVLGRLEAGLGPVLSQRTGEDGAYALPGLDPTTSWDLDVNTAGWQLARRHVMQVPPDTSTTVDLVVHRGAQLEGVVLDADNRPVADVLVAIAKAWTYSDAKGRFTIVGIPAGRHDLSVDISGLASVPMTFVWGEAKRNVQVRVPRLLSVAGVLVDAAGRPVPGFRVELSRVMDSAVTDAAGAFRLEQVPPGSYPFENESGDESQTVVAGDQDVRLVWAPIAVRRLQGRIVGPDGHPVPTATVTLWIRHQDDMDSDETQASGGWFSVSGYAEDFEEGTQVHLVVEQPRDAAGAPLDLQPAMMKDVDLSAPLVVRMERGAALSGRVVDEQGMPVAGCTLRATSEELEDGYFNNNTFEVVTLEDGTFRFIGIPNGQVSLSVDPPARYEAPPPRDLSTGTEKLTISLKRANRISGVVLLPSGKPAAWARVEGQWKRKGVATRSVVADAQGRFVLEGVGTQDVTLVVRRPTGWHLRTWPYLTPKVVAAPGASDVRIALELGGFIQCSVWQEDRRVSWAHITAYRLDDLSRAGSAMVSGAKPAFLGPLPLGSYRLIASTHGEQSGESVPVDVQVPSEGLRLEIEPARTLTGQIEGSATQMKYANVVFARTKPLAKAQARPEENGSFSMHVPTNAPGLLYVIGNGAVGYQRDARPSEGPYRLVLGPGKHIRGRVARPNPDGLKARIKATARSIGHETYAIINPDGTFELRQLLPAPYTIVWTLKGRVIGRIHDVQPGSDGVRIPLR